MKITADHMRGMFCVSGARTWARRHNLDFRDFLKNGIDSEKLLATGCGLAKQIVERVEKEAQDGQQ